MIKYILLLLFLSCERQNLPVVGLKIKPAYERDLHQWIKNNPGVTFEEAPKEYPGLLRTGTQSIKGKISLRGDLNSHWRGEKKSFRFISKDGQYIQGLKEVDFLIPQDKYYELELVGYALGKKLGLLTPEWKIVQFALNTHSYGPYLMLERWTPESMELRALPEGEIIRENNAWLDVITLKDASRYKNVFYSRKEFNPLSLRVEIYKGTFNKEISPYALNRFEKMLKDLSNWKDYIDEEEAVNWTALMLIMGSYHGILGDNIKWYYHPYQMKFRPIPYDFLPRKFSEHSCPLEDFGRMNVWINTWIKDQDFRQKLKLKISEFVVSGELQKVLSDFYEREDIRILDLNGKVEERKQIIPSNIITLLKAIDRKTCF